ncbi:unnamed protein product [Phytophthora lilii]|uniref:Unnamed protein product n=1 Tax=Phytophthora lilii TaxID=2077276 RepID=A0A9W6YKH9_9STRA|nr:unnamed protein product [Phytophthora lilii]
MSNINASVLDLPMSVAIFGSGIESSSPDGSSKPSSATTAVEARVAQACSDSHGVSSLASAETSSPAPSNSVVTREVLEELLVEAGAESSERLNAIVATHNEVYAKLAKRVQAAEDHAQRVSKQLVREQEVFKATVAANTAQCSRLHRLVASSDVADDSASARLRRRNEDLMERVQRLVKANRTLRARVQLEEMDPDVLVLISEGSLVMLVVLPFFVVNSQSIVLSSGLSTGELDGEALGVSDDTRTVLRQMYQSADRSNPDTLIADSLARVAFAEGDSLGETSSAARASESRRTSPGTSATEVHMDRVSRKKTPKSAERKRSREECALDRELGSSSRRPRLAADAAGQRDVDGSREVTNSRGEAADTETSVDLEFSSPAPSASRSNVETRPSGFFKAKSKSRSSSSSESSAWSASTQVLSSASDSTTTAPRTPSAACRSLDLSPPSTGSSAAGTRRSSRASAAQSSFKSSLMCELEDADDEDVRGGSSPPLTRPRSSSRPIVIDDDSDDDSESGVEPERTTVLVDSSVNNSRSAGSEASAVPRSNVSGHSPSHEALASGALAPSDGSSAVPTSREASTALVVRDSSIPAPPSAKTRAVQKSAAKTQAKAKKSSQKKKRARSTKAQSETSVPGVAPSESSAAARSSTSRPQSRRRQANCPQVDASKPSLPGLDSSSLRPAVDENPALADIPTEVLFEPSIPGYSFKYLTWIPKSSAWLSEVSALDELEPWRTGWVGAPAQHPYNTTFVPCNPSAPLFVPVGFSRESVGRQIQVDPALTASEISAGWDSDFRGPASLDHAQDASSATPRLATSNATLVAPSTEDPDHLLFLAQVSAAAEDAGEDGGDASEGS